MNFLYGIYNAVNLLLKTIPFFLKITLNFLFTMYIFMSFLVYPT